MGTRQSLSPHVLLRASARGLAWLARRQQPYGEFRTLRSADPTLRRGTTFESSPYATTYAVHALSFAAAPVAGRMIRRALAFLHDERGPDGTWRYWGRRAGREIVPDADDTACACFELQRAEPRYPIGRALRAILAHRDENGLFQTWFVPAGPRNDVDAVVNANVARLLGPRPETRPAVAWLVEVIREGREPRASLWGVSDLSLHYVVSRAWRQGLPGLAPCAPRIVERALDRQETGGGFGDDLATALALVTLLNFDATARGALDRGARALCERQRRDGSWRRAAFFRGPGFFGSEELTTALAVEVLTRLALPGARRRS